VPYPSSAYATSYGADAPPRFSSLSGLATGLTVLLGVAAVAALVASIGYFGRAGAVDDFGAGIGGIAAIDDGDAAVRRGFAMVLPIVLATWVVMIVWQFRHAQNAEKLRGPLGLGPGWAIGGWFIPLGYFVLPGMQIGQAAKASDPGLGPGDLRAKGKLPAAIVAWAVLFGAAICLFVAGNSSRPANEEIASSLDEYAMADRLVAAGMLVGAAAAVAAIMMVRTLTARQQRAVDGYQAPASPPPPPFQGRF
jgi:hypothetical protein